MSTAKVPGTAVCGKCGGERDGANTCYCKRCFREYQREWRTQKTGKPFVPRAPVADGMARCSRCKTEKPATTEFFYAAKGRRCGLAVWCKACHAAHVLNRDPPRPKLTATQRFWAKVNKDGPLHPALGTRCWTWPVEEGRYGQFWIGKGNVGAHVFSWTLHHGVVPRGMQINHKCDRGRCVNPTHLFLGTQLDNMRDKVAKGRQARGETGGNTKLTEQQVRRARELCASGTSFAAVAATLGVTYHAVASAVRRETWAHVGE
jgi:hypothetical protein